MKREIEEYHLYEISGEEFIAKRNDIMSFKSRGDKMLQRLKAADNEGKYKIGKDSGEIFRVKYCQSSFLPSSVEFPLLSDPNEISYYYKEFVEWGKPKIIRVTTEVIESLEELSAQTLCKVLYLVDN